MGTAEKVAAILRQRDRYGFAAGDRVGTHPATDAWMSGDRFGEVVSASKVGVRVRLDRSGRVLRFRAQDLEVV
jgi:hypothetical protein